MDSRQPREAGELPHSCHMASVPHGEAGRAGRDGTSHHLRACPRSVPFPLSSAAPQPFLGERLLPPNRLTFGSAPCRTLRQPASPPPLPGCPARPRRRRWRPRWGRTRRRRCARAAPGWRPGRRRRRPGPPAWGGTGWGPGWHTWARRQGRWGRRPAGRWGAGRGRPAARWRAGWAARRPPCRPWRASLSAWRRRRRSRRRRCWGCCTGSTGKRSPASSSWRRPAPPAAAATAASPAGRPPPTAWPRPRPPAPRRPPGPPARRPPPPCRGGSRCSAAGGARRRPPASPRSPPPPPPRRRPPPSRPSRRPASAVVAPAGAARLCLARSPACGARSPDPAPPPGPRRRRRRRPAPAGKEGPEREAAPGSWGGVGGISPGGALCGCTCAHAQARAPSSQALKANLEGLPVRVAESHAEAGVMPAAPPARSSAVLAFSAGASYAQARPRGAPDLRGAAGASPASPGRSAGSVGRCGGAAPLPARSGRISGLPRR